MTDQTSHNSAAGDAPLTAHPPAPADIHPGWSKVWITAVTLVLVTPAVTGLAGLIIVILTMIGSGLYFGFKHGPRAILGNRFAQFMTGAYGLILVSFLLNARTPNDLIFLANFLGILSAPALYFLARRHAGLFWTKRIVLMAALGSIVTFLVSVFDVFVADSYRAAGFILFGPNQMGQFALLFGAISLGGFMLFAETRIRLFLAAAAILSIGSVLLAGSRSAAIATGAALIIVAVFALTSKSRLRRWAWAALALLAVAGIGFSMSRISDGPAERIFALSAQVQQVLNEGYSDDSNIQVRLDLYQSGLQSFLSAPHTGVGWSQALEAGNAVVGADTRLDQRVRSITYPLMHNDVVAFGASMGLIGLLAFALMVVAPWLGLRPRDNLHHFRLYIVLIMAATFHAFALTDTSLSLDIGIVGYVMMSSLLLGTFRQAPQRPAPEGQTAG